MDIAYVANTNELLLTGLKSELDDTFINNASVTATVLDKDGDEVGGETWPITMAYVAASNGNYRGTLKYTLPLAPRQSYTAIIDANGDTTSPPVERRGHWQFKFKAETRTGDSE